MQDDEIYALINKVESDRSDDASYQAAHDAIKARIVAAGANEKQASAAMYYAYEHGHSSGYGEVLRIAFNLLTEVFDAK
jgi:hypothetical protein